MRYKVTARENHYPVIEKKIKHVLLKMRTSVCTGFLFLMFGITVALSLIATLEWLILFLRKAYFHHLSLKFIHTEAQRCKPTK